MDNLIGQYEKDDYFDGELNDEIDNSYLDSCERYDSERVNPDTPQAKHARSIVGKWCAGIDTPVHGDMLVKVISAGIYDLGCVNIITFKSSKGMFLFRHWRCVGGGGLADYMGSTWLKPTDKRPSLIDWIIVFPSILARIITCWLEHESKCFKYKWWKDGSYLYHQYNPYIANFIGAIYDFGRAFKYGVILPRS
jgi:hypothetical protein